MRRCLLVVTLVVVGCGKGKPTEAPSQPPDAPRAEPSAPLGPKGATPGGPTPPKTQPQPEKPKVPEGWTESVVSKGGFKAYGRAPTWSVEEDTIVKALDDKTVLFQGKRGLTNGASSKAPRALLFFHLPGTTPAQRAEAAARYFREIKANNKLETVLSERQLKWLGTDATEYVISHFDSKGPNRVFIRRVAALEDVVYVVVLEKWDGGRFDPAMEAWWFDNFVLTGERPVPPEPKRK